MVDIFNEDCLEGMKRIADNSVDMILTDLPYGITACKWDLTPIDLPVMWEQFKRILKPQCSAVLFASGKFVYKLVASNLDWYKYKWIWIKNTPTMFVHAKNAPMRKFEEILIFSDGVINHTTCTTRRMKYNPQGVVPCEFIKDNDGKDKPSQLRPDGRGSKYIYKTDKVSDVSLQGGKFKGNWRENYNWERHGRLKAFGDVLGKRPSHVDYYIQEQTGYPSDVLNFNVVTNPKKLHPTQKPTDLLEYLIRTYTNEGETVLDATMGSGSTGVAAVNTGRNFIGFELEEKFFDIARKRIDDAVAAKA